MRRAIHRRLRLATADRERGAGTLEYVGGVVLAAILVAALLLVLTNFQYRERVEQARCEITSLGQGDCGVVPTADERAPEDYVPPEPGDRPAEHRAPRHARIWSPQWEAGQEIRVHGGDVILWGRGEDLAAGDVTCTTRRDGPLPAGPPTDSTDLATLEDPEHGELVYLATSTYGFGFPIGSVVCDGPGLEAVLMSKNPRTPLNRGLAIGFVVAGGVAGLWALVTLRLTRSRDARRES